MTGETNRRVEPHESTLSLLDPRPLATRHKLGIVGMVVLALAPFYTEFSTLRMLTAALYLGMFAMSWDVVSGYTGEISFGHAFFFALGGYTSVVLSTELAVTPLLTIPVGVIVAALGGLLIGVPALRVKGPYLSLITLVAPLLLFQIFIIYRGTFGGESGLRGEPNLIGTSSDAVLTITSEFGALGAPDVVRILNFYLAFGLFIIIMLGLIAITRSNAGAVFYAIRSGEDVVSATGKNPAKFKIFVFVLSAAVGGLAGGVFAHSNVGAAQPGALLELELSLLVIVASVIGGMGTITGAALGGILVHVLENEVFGDIDDSLFGIDITWFNDIVGHSIASMDFLLVGVVGIVIVYTFPGGLLRWGVEKGETLRDRIDERRGDS